MKNKLEFTNKILAWGKQNNRPMPWKGEKNPYFIWLSEIILQQTRVEQGTKYFLAFKEKYPTIHTLAVAKESEILKLWEGLGYYSRARNLHFTAQYISKELKGVFPKKYDEIIRLKGIGTYTAAAISSFAYNLPIAVVDGNVVRVLSRVFGLKEGFQTVKEKRYFQNFANLLISKKEASIYNQAIMDFGAQVCTPKKYSCSLCVLSSFCYAFKNNLQDKLPIKKKKVVLKNRYFSFLIFNYSNSVYIEKRVEKDIWKGLYQFPKLETSKLLKNKKSITQEIYKKYNLKVDFEIKNISKEYIQQLTHQKIHANFIEIEVKSKIKQQFINTDINFLSKFAFPKIINVYLSSKN